MVMELRHDLDFEQLLEKSESDPVLIFKHSTQCSVSSEAYQEFTGFASSALNSSCGLVLVIENRGLSNTIASRLGIPHASPQAIVVKNGRPVWSASHWSITRDSLTEAFR
jgi:bacillithiol system protein YtxJ